MMVDKKNCTIAIIELLSAIVKLLKSCLVCQVSVHYHLAEKKEKKISK
jgi:hypothetical protein